jgi:hypothetical protein
MLSAYVSRDETPGFNSPISLRVLTCRKSILVLASGEQYLLLHDGRRVVQVRCLGDDLTRDPLAIALLADEFPNVERKIRILRRFAELYRATKPGRAMSGWTPPALRLRNALIALDGSMAGATYREIAEAIYGPTFVAERWGRGQRNLKDQLIRAVRRGRHLMSGGYAELLL